MALDLAKHGRDKNKTNVRSSSEGGPIKPFKCSIVQKCVRVGDDVKWRHRIGKVLLCRNVKRIETMSRA